MLLMEDRPLLDAYRRGEQAALYKVYEHYKESVAKTLRIGFTFSSGGQVFRFRGYATAFGLQDALQETFLKAFGDRARSGYSGLQPFAPYLMGIVRNLVIDDFRRRRREMALFVPESAELKLSRAEESGQQMTTGSWSRRSNPEMRAIEREQSALVTDFLGELDDATRILVRLRFVEGRSQDEVADILGVDRNRVRRLIKDLRLKLLRFMKRRGQIRTLDANELLGMLSLG